MASNYTDNYDGIATGAPLSAAKMTAALNTKEKVANKQVDSTDTAGTLTSSSSDSYYPSSKLVGKNLGTLRSDKQDKIPAGTAKNIVAYSGTVGTFGELARAATTMEISTASASDDKIPTEKAVAAALASSISALGLSGKEDASNKVTSITAANKDDAAKYPTTGAVAAWVATATSAVSATVTTLIDALLPSGTILAISISGWTNASTEFKSKWQVCDSTGGSPDLRDRFLRGGTATSAVSYDNPTTTNTQTISVPLLQHKHTASSSLQLWGDEGSDVASTTYTAVTGMGFDTDGGGVRGNTSVKKFTDNLVTTSIENTGTASASISVNTMPSYYTAIYIMKK
ncbi:MAG: hypothetical protein LBK68_06800 [Candidatus Margulisbacteria bacterium]|jgi:hypothetical protein|nr:hypothetical protein [Candidatus Margulisiibacteriota bacterium]